MEEAKNKLIKQAEKLRKRECFPFSLFRSPDYESSADKFKEAAGMSVNKEEKIRLLKESADTYLMHPLEYNRYNCYLIYGELAELYKDNVSEFLRYTRLAGDMAISCNRENLAANSYEKAVEVLVQGNDMNSATDLMRKVAECYNNSSWKHHYTNAIKKLAFLEFKTAQYEDAAKSFLKLEKTVYNLCAGICYYLGGVDSDLDITGEEGIVYKALGKSPDDLKVAIDLYLENNAVYKDIRTILNSCVEMAQPENDIL